MSSEDDPTFAAFAGMVGSVRRLEVGAEHCLVPLRYYFTHS